MHSTGEPATPCRDGDERVGGRFVLARLLKHGNGVATYEGVDTSDGSPVIVKIVGTSGVSTAVRLRLEHEANVLQLLDCGTSHPLLDSGYDGEHFYLVQPASTARPCATGWSTVPCRWRRRSRWDVTSSRCCRWCTTGACSTATSSRRTSSCGVESLSSGPSSSTSASPAAPSSMRRCATSRSAPPATWLLRRPG